MTVVMSMMRTPASGPDCADGTVAFVCMERLNPVARAPPVASFSRGRNFVDCLALPQAGCLAQETTGPKMHTISVNSKRVQLFDDEAAPLGDAPLAPSGLTGASEAQLAKSMAERLRNVPPESDAEVLTRLRRTFPESPLSVRVAALAA